MIKEGTCGIWVAKEGHEPERVATLKTGHVFGEMSLLTGEKRSATVRADTDLVVIEIGKELFGSLLAASHGVLESLGTLLAERQAQLKTTLGRQAQELSERARATSSQFVNRIKAFFGLR